MKLHDFRASIRIFSAVMSVVVSTFAGSSSSAIAETQDLTPPGVPVTTVSFVEQDGEVRGAQFIVPDADTTQSLQSGRLRRYDLHIAKMMEITDYECRQPDRMWSRISWQYRAGGGDISMGRFDISCDLARDTAVSYGFAQPEIMPVTYHHARAVITVPVLNITGAKVDKWLNFTQTFHPSALNH